jgi:hypothetical protein
VSRRTDQLDRIEATLARIEDGIGKLGVQTAVARTEAKGARASAEAAYTAVQALAAATVKPEALKTVHRPVPRTAPKEQM